MTTASRPARPVNARKAKRVTFSSSNVQQMKDPYTQAADDLGLKRREVPPTGEEVKGALQTAIHALRHIDPDQASVLRKFYTAVYDEHIPFEPDEDEDYDLDDDELEWDLKSGGT